MCVPLRRRKIPFTLRGPSAEGDAVASASGPAHKRFLETRVEKISVVPYSISGARFGTHAPDDPFYVSPSLAGSCIARITFAATPTPPHPYSYITVYTQLKILIETSCEIHEICNIHITFCGQSFSDGSLSLSLSLSLTYRTINPIIPELSITLQHC